MIEVPDWSRSPWVLAAPNEHICGCVYVMSSRSRISMGRWCRFCIINIISDGMQYDLGVFTGYGLYYNGRRIYQ